jgi:hypothetical protein
VALQVRQAVIRTARLESKAHAETPAIRGAKSVL